MPPGNQTRRIEVVVSAGSSAQQMKILADGMGNVNQNTKKMADGLSYLTNSFNSLFAGYLGISGIRQLVAVSDTMQGLTNRIAVFTGSHESALNVMDRITETANSTKTSVADLGEVYARLGSSLQSTKISSEVLLSLTKVLQNSFRISGSTISETTATIIQLSQAFASGTLRGQELRSVMLQNATLARLLRERFGPNLAKDAEAGLISITEVMKVLFKHQNEINSAAEKMAPTFGQTLTTAFNNAANAINHLNEAAGAAKAFASFMDVLVEKLPLIGIAIVVLATTQIPLLTAATAKLSLALYELALSNPVTAVLLLITLAVLALIKNFDHLKAKWLELSAVFKEMGASLDSFWGKLSNKPQVTQRFDDRAKELRDEAEGLREQARALKPKEPFIGPLQEDPQAAALRAAQDAYVKGLKNNSPDKVKKIKDILADLNKQLFSGKISIEQYNKKILDFDLYKLNRQFNEGKFDVEHYRLELQKLEQRKIKILFDEGAISLDQFNAKISSSKIEELNIKIRAGSLSLKDYNRELIKVADGYALGAAFGAGAADYVDSLGNKAQQVAGIVKEAFSGVEKAFIDFTKNADFNWKEFAQGILDDLLKIIIRAQVLAPIANSLNLGIASLLSTPSSTGGISEGNKQYGGVSQNAHGNIFDHGLTKFASGGVVSGATMFGYGKGQRGVLGEVGPEAILPLTRGTNGNLGVQASVSPVNINIVNQSGGEVEQRGTTGPGGERMIDILIKSKVREGLASGSFDKVFHQSYGIRRKGS